MFGRIFARRLASAANKSAVKLPAKLYGLEGTYASALFTAASKESSIESAYKSLTKLHDVISRDRKLAHILTNPAISSQDRSSVVEILAKEEQLDTTVANLLGVLAENNRLAHLERIVSQFGILNDAYGGVIRATVTTAQPLDPKSFKRVEKALASSQLVGSSKTLKLENTVNPEIKGGLVVEIADRTVDLSIASKIQRLNELLKQSI